MISVLTESQRFVMASMFFATGESSRTGDFFALSSFSVTRRAALYILYIFFVLLTFREPINYCTSQSTIS